MPRCFALGFALLAFSAFACAQKQPHAITTPVPQAPAPTATPQSFRDKHYGVRFEVPPGWSLTRKDGQVSTFHLDARSAGSRSEVRGVAAIEFNPFPLSTFSGAMFYYSVQPHTDDLDCAAQAVNRSVDSKHSLQNSPQNIGGMDFAHGHDEHGSICVEARDEVYTAFRKGACYRFDLELNTFCAESSGAMELTVRQYNTIEAQMNGILDSVMLDWRPRSAGPRQPVPLPDAAPRRELPPVQKPAPRTGASAAAL
jgi:hypothetical protein